MGKIRDLFKKTRDTIQWLGLLTSTARGIGLIPDQVTKIPHAVQWGQKKKKKNLY